MTGFILITFVLEALVLVVALKYRMIYGALALHILATAAFGMIFFLKDEGTQTDMRAVWFYGVILVFFFPCAGIAAALLLILMVKEFTKHSGEDPYEDIDEDAKKNGLIHTTAKTYINVLQDIRKGLSFDSFIDIIRSGNDRVKERVIDKLSRDISPHSVRILKEAVREASPDVRLCAVGALLKIEETLSEKIQLAIRMTQKRGAAKDFGNLGDLYRMYATIGLIESQNTNYYLSLACKAYRKSLDISARNPEVLMTYARSLLSLEKYEEAGRLLDQAAKTWPQRQDVFLLRTEVYFALGQFREVAGRLNSMESADFESRMKEVAAFWKDER